MNNKNEFTIHVSFNFELVRKVDLSDSFKTLVSVWSTHSFFRNIHLLTLFSSDILSPWQLLGVKTEKKNVVISAEKHV